MLSRFHLSSYLVLVAITWGIVAHFHGIDLFDWKYLKPFGFVLCISVVAVKIFTKWAWSWWIFRINDWYVDRPDLRGTWEVMLTSDWIDPETHAPKPPFTVYVTIRQTFLSLSLRMMTSESQSQLVAHSVEKEEDGLFRLTGIYRNEPQIQLQKDKSKIHYGAMLLRLNGSPVESMSGHYWTDRSTSGRLEFIERKEDLCNTFQQAVDLFT